MIYRYLAISVTKYFLSNLTQMLDKAKYYIRMTFKGKNSVFDKIIFLAVESNNVGDILENATT